MIGHHRIVSMLRRKARRTPKLTDLAARVWPCRLVLHELGVLHYHNGEYHEAARYFLQVATEDATRRPADLQTRNNLTLLLATLLCCVQPYFAACNSTLRPSCSLLCCRSQVAEDADAYDAKTREPSIFNLGHAYRKLRMCTPRRGTAAPRRSKAHATHHLAPNPTDRQTNRI